MLLSWAENSRPGTRGVYYVNAFSRDEDLVCQWNGLATVLHNAANRSGQSTAPHTGT
jgi:hypothetical protein